MIFGSTAVLCCFIAARFVEKFKRRTMLMIGTLLCVLFNVCLSVTYLFKGPQVLVLIFLMLFLLAYNLGPEPVMYLIFSEMFPEDYKILLNGYGYFINWVANIATVFIFEFFVGGKEWVVYLIYGVCTLFFGVTGAILAPETLGRTLPDIEAEIRTWRKGQKPLKTVMMAKTLN